MILRSGTLALASPAVVSDQSCAFCYLTAANSGAQFIQALKRGILMLLFPSLFTGICVVVIAYRKRNQYAEDWESVDQRDEVLCLAAEDTSSGPQQSSVAFTTSSLITSPGQ